VSLTAHLTAGTAEHGRLAFHPDCPRCRAERLAGNLAGDSLVSRRGQAALAAGLLAFSAGAPPSALAQAPDAGQHQEETTPGGEPPGLEPDFDPGGGDTFDYDTAPLPGGAEAGGSEDEGIGPPVESEPTTDPDARQLLDEEQAPTPPPPAPEPMPAPTPATPSVPAAPLPLAPEPPAGEQAAPQPEQRHTASERKAPERSPKTHEAERRSVFGPSPTPRPDSPIPVAEALASPARPTSTPVAVASPPITAAVSQPGSPADGVISGQSYTVRAGDSLWSIARRLVGPKASAGRIAREVNRLWELNRDRIGTGNPSLIHVGTVLKL
jgi:nucleoid-associated protein YgaU